MIQNYEEMCCFVKRLQPNAKHLDITTHDQFQLAIKLANDKSMCFYGRLNMDKVYLVLSGISPTTKYYMLNKDDYLTVSQFPVNSLTFSKTFTNENTCIVCYSSIQHGGPCEYCSAFVCSPCVQKIIDRKCPQCRRVMDLVLI